MTSEVNAMKKCGFFAVMAGILFSACVSAQTYSDSATITADGVTTYYSGELLYMEWDASTNLGVAGYNAYTSSTSSKGVQPNGFGSRAGLLSVEVVIRDPVTNDIVDTVFYTGCHISQIDYIGGNSHIYYGCP